MSDLEAVITPGGRPGSEEFETFRDITGLRIDAYNSFEDTPIPGPIWIDEPETLRLGASLGAREEGPWLLLKPDDEFAEPLVPLTCWVVPGMPGTGRPVCDTILL